MLSCNYQQELQHYNLISFSEIVILSYQLLRLDMSHVSVILRGIITWKTLALYLGYHMSNNNTAENCRTSPHELLIQKQIYVMESCIKLSSEIKDNIMLINNSYVNPQEAWYVYI